MATFAEQMQGVALSLISDFGEPATFTRISGGTFDPVTGTKTGETTETWDVTCAPVAYAEQVYDGVNVKTGDIKLMIPAGTYTPQAGDRVTYNSQQWFVVGVPKFTRAQGQAITYQVQIRK